MEEQIQKLREMLSQSRNTVAVTGAGISITTNTDCCTPCVNRPIHCLHEILLRHQTIGNI